MKLTKVVPDDDALCASVMKLAEKKNDVDRLLKLG